MRVSASHETTISQMPIVVATGIEGCVHRKRTLLQPGVAASRQNSVRTRFRMNMRFPLAIILGHRSLSGHWWLVHARRRYGPLDTSCVCPSDETQIAPAPATFLTSSLPFSGPTSSSVVESASDADPVSATALTAKGVFT